MSHAKHLPFRSIEPNTRLMTMNVHFFPSQTPFLAYPPKTPGVNPSTDRDQIAQSYYSLNQRGLLMMPGLSRYMTNAYRNISGAAQTLRAPPLPLPALPRMLLPRALTSLRCVTHIPAQWEATAGGRDMAGERPQGVYSPIPSLLSRGCVPLGPQLLPSGTSSSAPAGTAL